MIFRGVVLLIAVWVAASPVAAKSLLPRGRSAPARSADASADPACAAFGPGYRRIEGSESCVRVSGAMRVEMEVDTSGRSLFGR